jgi:hypothetical protein
LLTAFQIRNVRFAHILDVQYQRFPSNAVSGFSFARSHLRKLSHKQASSIRLGSLCIRHAR